MVPGRGGTRWAEADGSVAAGRPGNGPCAGGGACWGCRGGIPKRCGIGIDGCGIGIDGCGIGIVGCDIGIEGTDGIDGAISIEGTDAIDGAAARRWPARWGGGAPCSTNPLAIGRCAPYGAWTIGLAMAASAGAGANPSWATPCHRSRSTTEAGLGYGGYEEDAFATSCWRWWASAWRWWASASLAWWSAAIS